MKKQSKSSIAINDLPARTGHRNVAARDLRMTAGGMCIAFGTSAGGICKVDYQCWNE
jgi:hypothetical protein